MIVHVCSFISVSEKFEVSVGPTQKNYTPHNPLQQCFSCLRTVGKRREGTTTSKQNIDEYPGAASVADAVNVNEKSDLQNNLRKNDATASQKVLFTRVL